MRSLDTFSGPSSSASLEERNKAIVAASFFNAAWVNKREEQEKAGVRFALDAKKYLNMVDYKLVNKLELGHAQFFDYHEIPGPTTQSTWVSAEGFFYVLSFAPAACQQKKFESPVWIMQAGVFKG